MIIGVPKEIKDKEGRVGLTPSAVRALVDEGHRVLIERDAGKIAGFDDHVYQREGAVPATAEEAWNADLVVKVKEPLPAEYHYLKRQIVFTFFHLAGVDRGLTESLLANGTTAIAYETLEDATGALPLLAPMSAIAGNMAALMGAYYLAKFNAGKGVLLGKILGAKHGRVLVVGDGVVGLHAAGVALAMGAEVVIAGIDPERMQMLKQNEFAGADFIISNVENLTEHVARADLVIGAVLCRGDRAPKIITEKMIKSMAPGSVVVDVSIDQGGCIETSAPTTHSQPVFIKHDVVHYCVANMPGAYPQTATLALVDATLPYVRKIAAGGVSDLAREGGGVAKSVLTYQGKLTNAVVAHALTMSDSYRELERLAL